jgi:hypothetical protein
MIQEESCQAKFATLLPWLGNIIQEIKKEIKLEYLPRKTALIHKYFTHKSIAKLSTEDLVIAFKQEIENGNEDLCDWMCNQWVYKYTAVYQFFADFLSKLYPDFETITLIEGEAAQRLMNQSVLRFGAVVTYIFSIFNTVKFPEEIYQKLRQAAESARG